MIIEVINLEVESAICPHCKSSAAPRRAYTRYLHDVGDSIRSRSLKVVQTIFCCSGCGKHFIPDDADYPKGARYTEAVADALKAMQANGITPPSMVDCMVDRFSLILSTQTIRGLLAS